ncbi:MAG: nodulation protein NfeD [Candidatus Tectomicrobia bacterium]|uniref:Nodulation protein NfeD n=1 Tax=Tectimicrobiota bacterium TaxID=2528274 RepID=A0A932GP93_UNCTE|nr:nodulation protein NfeD [Candidatus Tectomicrobia bacterium]
MKRHRRIFSAGLPLCLLLFLLPVAGHGSPAREIGVLKFDGVINPVAAEFMINGIQNAVRSDSEALIIQMDTPGGLDTSMRAIIKEILNSPVPIVVFVAPSGSRAASAGAFITIAAHVAAMARGSNIGAAHPVAMGGQKMDETMSKKVENDAAAYMRSLAEKRGRNVKWAEEAVRKSVSISETEALKLKVIDVVAEDMDDLLARLDGWKTTTASGEKVIHTKGLKVAEVRMSVRQKILALLSDPNIAYMLLLLGMYGIFFELTSPGAIFPGVIGGISIILALYALQALPVNYAGLLLILLALGLFIAEIKVTSHGLLTMGGIVSMVFGSLMLINSDAPFLRISLSIIIPAALLTAAFFTFLLTLALKAQRRVAVSGAEGLINLIGTAQGPIQPTGKVFVHGELWDARSSEPIQPGQKVRVVKMEGLRLTVEKVKEDS